MCQFSLKSRDRTFTCNVAIFMSVNWSVYVIYDAKDRQGKRRSNSVADMTKMRLQYASCKPRPELNISLQLYLWTQ